MTDNSFHTTVESLIQGMDSFLSSKTVVGDAIHIGDTILLPLVEMCIRDRIQEPLRMSMSRIWCSMGLSIVRPGAEWSQKLRIITSGFPGNRKQEKQNEKIGIISSGRFSSNL